METVRIASDVTRSSALRTMAFLACLCAVACSADDQKRETFGAGNVQDDQLPPPQYSRVLAVYPSQRLAIEQGTDVTTKSFQTELIADVKPVDPKVVETVPIKVISQPDDSRMATVADKKPTFADAVAPPHGLVAQVEPDKGKVQILEYDKSELQALAEVLTARGIAEPAPPIEHQGNEVTGDRFKGWSSPNATSNGVDNRVNLSNASNWEYKTYGRLWAAGGCTAALFGRRLAITAAHCIIDSQGNYVAGNLSLRQKGTYKPYGTQSVQRAWFGGRYLANCINGAWDLNRCIPEDWALLVLEDNFPSGHPGWMGFAYPAESYVRPLTKRSVGYPGCGLPESPTNCRDNQLYGQTASCTINEFMYPFSNGFNAAFSHSCDVSPGHSGSAHYYRDAGNLYIFGIASCQLCSTCTVASVPDSTTRRYPNLDKRIDDFIYNMMVNLRVQYP